MAPRNSRKVQQQIAGLLGQIEVHLQQAREHLARVGKHLSQAKDANPRNYLMVDGALDDADTKRADANSALADANSAAQQALRVFETSYNAVLDKLEQEISDRDALIAQYEALLARHAPGVAPESATVLKLVKSKRQRRDRRRRTGN